MANPNEKNPGNAPGPFYVDSTCIDCDMCREIAPATFRRNDDLGMSIAHRQPVTPEEWKQACEALQNCPTGTIGDDGADT